MRESFPANSYIGLLKPLGALVAGRIPEQSFTMRLIFRLLDSLRAGDIVPELQVALSVRLVNCRTHSHNQRQRIVGLDDVEVAEVTSIDATSKQVPA